MEGNQYHHLNQNIHQNIHHIQNINNEILKPFDGRKRSNKQGNTENFKVEKSKYESNKFSDDDRILFLNLMKNDWSLKNMNRISNIACLLNPILTKPTRNQRRLQYGMFNWFKSNLQIILGSFASSSTQKVDLTVATSDQTDDFFKILDSFVEDQSTFFFDL
jgi:hypothetical protein